MRQNNEWIIAWDGKYNSGFCGSKPVNSISGLIDTLKMKDADGDAEFVLYRKGMEDQRLILCVTDNKWFLCFFPEDVSSCGFQSLGDDRDNSEITHMLAGSNIEVRNYTLVKSEVAFKAAQEFMEMGELPLCVDWEEL